MNDKGTVCSEERILKFWSHGAEIGTIMRQRGKDQNLERGNIVPELYFPSN